MQKHYGTSSRFRLNPSSKLHFAGSGGPESSNSSDQINFHFPGFPPDGADPTGIGEDGVWFMGIFSSYGC